MVHFKNQSLPAIWGGLRPHLDNSWSFGYRCTCSKMEPKFGCSLRLVLRSYGNSRTPLLQMLVYSADLEGVDNEAVGISLYWGMELHCRAVGRNWKGQHQEVSFKICFSELSSWHMVRKKSKETWRGALDFCTFTKEHWQGSEKSHFVVTHRRESKIRQCLWFATRS